MGLLLRVNHSFTLSHLRASALIFNSTLSKFSTEGNDEHNIPKRHFKIFKDEDARIILDVGEERLIHQTQKSKPNYMTTLEAQCGINYKRGVAGVFDIEDLVDVLKMDNARNIVVIKVPDELNYVDYLVVVTAHSRRHLLGLAEYIRRVFKKKRHSSDIIPAIEGENSTDWIAMDLGNIALHIMSEKARDNYDLESLWTLGPLYDTKVNSQEDSILHLLKKHSINLDDFQPAKGE